MRESIPDFTSGVLNSNTDLENIGKFCSAMLITGNLTVNQSIGSHSNITALKGSVIINGNVGKAVNFQVGGNVTILGRIGRDVNIILLKDGCEVIITDKECSTLTITSCQGKIITPKFIQATDANRNADANVNNPAPLAVKNTVILPGTEFSYTATTNELNVSGLKIGPNAHVELKGKNSTNSGSSVTVSGVVMEGAFLSAGVVPNNFDAENLKPSDRSSATVNTSFNNTNNNNAAKDSSFNNNNNFFRTQDNAEAVRERPAGIYNEGNGVIINQDNEVADSQIHNFSGEKGLIVNYGNKVSGNSRVFNSANDSKSAQNAYDQLAKLVSRVSISRVNQGDDEDNTARNTHQP